MQFLYIIFEILLTGIWSIKQNCSNLTCTLYTHKYGCKDDNSCSCVLFVSYWLISIRLYRSTQTQHVY